MKAWDQIDAVNKGASLADVNVVRVRSSCSMLQINSIEGLFTFYGSQ